MARGIPRKRRRQRHTFHKPLGAEKRSGQKWKRTEDGICFDSIAECRYYRHLKLLRSAGDVVFFLRQVPFHLPGGVVYRCDFMEFRGDGSVRFVDVKGFETDIWRRNKRQVEALYPVRIEIEK